MTVSPLVVGTDLVEIARITRLADRYGARFLERVYTPGELTACGGRPESLAGRWAVKEATAKALGAGIGDVAWRDIETVQDAKRRPHLRLSGRAASLAEELGLRHWAVSLAHDGGMALAFVVGS